MTLVDKAMRYAQTHLQAVRICWLDQKVTTCDAEEAVSYAAACLLVVSWVSWRKIRSWRICYTS